MGERHPAPLELDLLLDPFLGRPLLLRSAVAVPGSQVWLGVDRPAVQVDLEVQVAADRAGVAGPADVPDDLADVDELPFLESGGVMISGAPPPPGRRVLGLV